MDKQWNVLYDPLCDVDEGALSKTDRIGLAYCRLNDWKWDEFIGPKPEGFDDLPNFDRNDLKRISHPIIMRFLSCVFPGKYKKKLSKDDFIDLPMRGIKSEIGEANISRCWWVYKMKRTEEEWRKWYYSTEHIKV